MEEAVILKDANTYYLATVEASDQLESLSS